MDAMPNMGMDLLVPGRVQKAQFILSQLYWCWTEMTKQNFFEYLFNSIHNLMPFCPVNPHPFAGSDKLMFGLEPGKPTDSINDNPQGARLSGTLAPLLV